MKKTHLAENLLFLRTYHNYTQLFVASKLHISQPSYCDIEKGRTSFNEDYEKPIEEIYQIPFHFIKETTKAHLAVLLDEKQSSKL